MTNMKNAKPYSRFHILDEWFYIYSNEWYLILPLLINISKDFILNLVK